MQLLTDRDGSRVNFRVTCTLRFGPSGYGYLMQETEPAREISRTKNGLLKEAGIKRLNEKQAQETKIQFSV